MKNTITAPPLHALRTAAERIGRQANCRMLVLFGSAAREGGAPPRDLDLGALAEGRADTVEITNLFIRALGIQAIDVADLGRADPLLMMLVARDGIALYERSAGEFARFASLAARRYADTRKFRALEKRQIEDFIDAGHRRP